MTIASPNGESKKYNNRKANAIKTEIEVVSIFNLYIHIAKKRKKVKITRNSSGVTDMYAVGRNDKYKRVK